MLRRGVRATRRRRVRRAERRRNRRTARCRHRRRGRRFSGVAARTCALRSSAGCTAATSSKSTGARVEPRVCVAQAGQHVEDGRAAAQRCRGAADRRRRAGASWRPRNASSASSARRTAPATAAAQVGAQPRAARLPRGRRRGRHALRRRATRDQALERVEVAEVAGFAQRAVERGRPRIGVSAASSGTESEMWRSQQRDRGTAREVAG